MADVNSPIQSVTPIDIDGNVLGVAITDIPTPSKFEQILIDISAPDAGGTEDNVMHKMRQGQKIRINLEWSYPTIADASSILSTFNSEYVLVNYLDAKAGAWQDRRFYIGDRNAPLWNSARGRWTSVSFPIIQQVPDLITT